MELDPVIFPIGIFRVIDWPTGLISSVFSDTFHLREDINRKLLLGEKEFSEDEWVCNFRDRDKHCLKAN